MGYCIIMDSTFVDMTIKDVQFEGCVSYTYWLCVNEKCIVQKAKEGQSVFLSDNVNYLCVTLYSDCLSFIMSCDSKENSSNEKKCFYVTMYLFHS